jgi:hypothetical protein
MVLASQECVVPDEEVAWSTKTTGDRLGTSATVSGGAEFSATEISDVGEVGYVRSIGTRNREGLTLPN